MNPYTKIRAALERALEVLPTYAKTYAQLAEALTALAELEKTAAEPVAWMWNDEIGVPHASAGSKKPVWLESSASAEYIKQANLRPLYAAQPAPAAEIREPTPEECERIYRHWEQRATGLCRTGRDIFDAVSIVMRPKSEAK